MQIKKNFYSNFDFVFISIILKRWYISEWSSCSTTCGEGTRTRRLHCIKTIEGGDINMLDFGKCSGDVPAKIEKCIVIKKCPAWDVGKWSMVKKTIFFICIYFT